MGWALLVPASPFGGPSKNLGSLPALYGGGPEVLINTEGGVRVSSPSPAAVAGKTRNLRCEETHLED